MRRRNVESGEKHTIRVFRKKHVSFFNRLYIGVASTFRYDL